MFLKCSNQEAARISVTRFRILRDAACRRRARPELCGAGADLYSRHYRYESGHRNAPRTVRTRSKRSMFPRFGFGNAANSSEIARPVRAVAGPRNLRLGQAPVSSATEVNFWKCGKSSGCEFEQRPATL